jgi:hypothetical protein
VINLRGFVFEGKEFMNRFFTALLCLTTTFSVLAAEGFSSVEEQMTGKEFTAAGLDKLSQQELDVLNDWIRRHSVATLDTPKTAAVTSDSGEDRRGLKSDDDDDEERTTISSNLIGKFRGWDGQTTFKLENGMIWVQSDKDKFFIKEVENPVVIIEPGFWGTWRLHIDGFNSECRVKRIQ